MGKVRFALVLHNHQPVGNFDGVIEAAYRDSYLPFLEVMERYPRIPVSLHTSGCLMEWIAERHPEYVERLRALVAAGQVEIVGGGFYEPILPMIPSHDRLGQIRGYSEYLADLFGANVRGMWVPERVWEQSLVRDIVDAGVGYTLLDDYHFRKAGLRPEQLYGYFLTEDEGRLLRVFPGSEPMRYLIPFQTVDRFVETMRSIASERDNALVVFADDGEKFGVWPDTKRHVYEDGWIFRFFDALMANRDWIECVTCGQAIDETAPLGKVYLPDCSYREMTEWALPAERLVEYDRLWHELDHHPSGGAIKEYLKGGFWRNFKVRYPETNEMYARMLDISRRLERLSRDSADALGDSRLNQARTELYRGQCNCAYWHGAFGGMYLPHLRNAIFTKLIEAENHLLSYERETTPRFVNVEHKDFNLDGHSDVKLENDQLSCWIDPRQGGMLYEFDVRAVAVNLGASISRRYEAYHDKIRAFAGRAQDNYGSIHDRVVFKQEGLDRKLIYDPYPRKSLLDHFFDPETTLDAVANCQARELGSFVTAPYRATIAQNGEQGLVSLAARGTVAGRDVSLTKAISLEPGKSSLRVRYRLENLEPGRPIVFAIEFNIAGVAAHADDRYFYTKTESRVATLGSTLAVPDSQAIGLVDEWIGIDIGLSLSRPATLWTFPIESVSGSEGGFELVHQSVCLMPAWSITPTEPVWDVELNLATNAALAESRRLAATH